MDSDFNGGYGGALRAEVCSVGCNVWENKNIQTVLLSEMLSSRKNCVCRTSFCCTVVVTVAVAVSVTVVVAVVVNNC